MHVLAVEHDDFVAEQLSGCARRLGLRVTTVPTGREALDLFDDSDLVLIDLDLPDLDGLDICRHIRTAGDTPVIAIAGGDSEADRVLGLKAGADDCMGKPVGMRELAARIEALLRRVNLARQGSVLECGALRIDPAVREVAVGSRTVPLTRKEFDLLHLLATDTGRVFTREELMTRIWQDGGAVSRRSSGGSRTLDTHVASLRNKIGSGGCIVTVRGVGFRLDVAGSLQLAS